MKDLGAKCFRRRALRYGWRTSWFHGKGYRRNLPDHEGCVFPRALTFKPETLKLETLKLETLKPSNPHVKPEYGII